MEQKDRKFKATYRIGEIAHMLSLHPQTIRYYDKVGIVLPGEKNQKRERLYASYDAYMIMVRKQYQNMGFTIEETEKIFYKNDLDELLAGLEYRIAENQKELLNKQYCLEGMQRLKDLVEAIPTFYRRCFYAKRPARWHHLHLQDDILENTANSILARQIAMEAMPVCRHTLGIRQSDIETLQEVVSTYCDLTMEEKYASFYGFDQISTSFFVQAKPCIYTIIKVDIFDSVKWSYLDYVQQFMSVNNLLLDGDIQLSTIVNASEASLDKQERYRFFEVWVPIKNEIQ